MGITFTTGDFGLIINSMLTIATPLIFAAMGSIFSERSGVVNIGIEGMMLIGAFVGSATALATQNPWIGLLGAGAAGMLFAFLHGIACLNFGADQTISGVAINLLATGFAVFLCKLLFDGSTSTPAVNLSDKIPRFFQGDGFHFEQGGFFDWVFGTYATVYLSFVLVIVCWLIFSKTRFGMRIDAVGENPAAADTLGINVYGTRMSALLISGFLAGIAGAVITLSTVSGFRPNVIAGRGFIAIAAVIFGKYRPGFSLVACLLFGLCEALATFMGSPSVGLMIPEQILSGLPYVLTLVLLLFTGRSMAPAASGKFYDKNA